jgi:ParB-like chromosome segregation protein Spo0J
MSNTESLAATTQRQETGVSHSFVQIEEMSLTALGLDLQRVRCPPPSRVEMVQRDLAINGQLTPLVARLSDKGPPELLDGFKRLRAARSLGWQTLKVGCLEATEATALAMMLSLNRRFGLSHVEEALVVQELLRSGLTGVEVGVLLGRHKSWVSRRLGLVERLAPELLEELKLGLLHPGMARRLLVLPRGNQVELAAVARKAALGVRQTEMLVQLWRRAPSEKARQFILTQPQEALEAAASPPKPTQDPRLSTEGQTLQRSVRAALAAMAALIQGLEKTVMSEDRALLQKDFATLSQRIQKLSSLLGQKSAEPS